MKLALPAAIMAASLLTLAVLARHHTLGSYATETDFYHLYGPDAERIGTGQLPENDNKGPAIRRSWRWSASPPATSS